MSFFNKYTNKVVKYDLINKFRYKNIKKLPKLQYVLLNFNLPKNDTKKLIPLISSLKLIMLQDSKITISKTSNIVLKISKGQPVGCKVTLRKLKMNEILFKLLNIILPKSKYNYENNTNAIFSLSLENPLIFDELENNYQFFKVLPKLNISVKFTNCSIEEFFFLIQTYKLINL